MRAAAEPIPQAGQCAGQGGELAAERLNLLLLGQDEPSGRGWPQQTIRIWNPGRRRAHHRRSLPEMQPGIKLPSRFSRAEGRGETYRPLNGYNDLLLIRYP